MTFQTKRRNLKQQIKHITRCSFKRCVDTIHFFPVSPAIVKKDFLWNGHHFKEGKLVLLDLYGTNHHHELWTNPNKFVPERFGNWNKSPFELIPQGGGNHIKGHR